MKVTLLDKSENRSVELVRVEYMFFIGKNHSQYEQIQNALLIIHKQNHSEKYRLYNDAQILEVSEE